LWRYSQLKVHHWCHSNQQHWWQIFWWKGQWPLNTLQLHVSLLWLTFFLYSVSRCCWRFCCCRGFCWCGILLLLTSFFSLCFYIVYNSSVWHLCWFFSRSHAAYWQFCCRWNPAVVNMLLLSVLPLKFVSLLILVSLQWLVFLPFLALMPLCDILQLIRVLRLSSLKMVAHFSPTFNNNGGHWKSLERCDHQYHWYWWYTLKKKLIWT